MIPAVTHSHHSLRSIRWKFVRRTLLGASPVSPMFLARSDGTGHPRAPTYLRTRPCLRDRK